MTPNDERQENLLTQNYNSSQQPPGADVAGPPTFTYSGQAGPSLQDSLPQGHASFEEDTSQMITQFSISFQGNGPETSLYPLSPPCSVSPTPSHRSQVSLPGNWNSSSFPAPNAPRNLSLHHLPAHTRSVSQPSMMSSRTPRSRRGPTRTDVNAGLPGYSRLSSTTLLPTPVATPFFGQLPHDLHGAPEEFTRRHSEADVLGGQGAPPWQNTLIHQVAPAMCQPHPERSAFSPVPSSSHGPCSGFIEFGTDGGYLPDQLPTPSGSQEDSWVSVSSMTPSPEPFSVAEPDAIGAPFQTADYPPSRNDISPESPLLPDTKSPGNGRLMQSRKAPGAAKGPKNPKYSRTSKRHKEPMDLKAASRLQGRREKDEKDILALWNLFVPKSENIGMKKDRLETIVRYATEWVENTQKNALLYATSRDRRYHAREGSVSQMEGGVSRRQGQLVGSSDGVLGVATYLGVSDLVINDTMGSTSSALQKHDTLFAHRPN
ncbi:hypothetical protein H4582DRAFT_2078283 [Lactarius indigo]|nr:hypothetical protein H4582DRAFT_2078283 [Lactarius indigo]